MIGDLYAELKTGLADCTVMVALKLSLSVASVMLSKKLHSILSCALYVSPVHLRLLSRLVSCDCKVVNRCLLEDVGSDCVSTVTLACNSCACNSWAPDSSSIQKNDSLSFFI